MLYDLLSSHADGFLDGLKEGMTLGIFDVVGSEEGVFDGI